MEQLIASIYDTLKGYRADEKDQSVHMTKERIETWIKQFDRPSRLPILTELDSIFKKRYYTKEEVQKYLEDLVEYFSKEFGFKNPTEFLKSTDFLDLQGYGKSQKIMLSIFDNMIQKKYNITLAECGSVSKKYSFYLDDVLCTGLTMMTNIKEWLEKEFSKGKTNNQALADKSTKLIIFYIVIHEKNYNAKIWEMGKNNMDVLKKNHTLYYMKEIKNDIYHAPNYDLIYPIEENQSEEVIEYKKEIIDNVDEYTVKKNYKTKEDFYRPPDLPKKEVIFTSTENRAIVENAFLTKGIEILNASKAKNPQIRALGYSLPSQKNFGFGALCFTWRNVPNNTPLVFWYVGGGFTPLFTVKKNPNAEDIFQFLVER